MDKTPSKKPAEGQPAKDGSSKKAAKADGLSGAKKADSKEGLSSSKKRSGDTPKKSVSKRQVKSNTHCDKDATGTLWFPTDEDCVPHIPEISWASLAWDVAMSLGSALSGDLFSSGISVPCNMYEPLSILQRSIEFLEFTSSLDLAASMKSAGARHCYVAGFALSPLPIAENRWRLDFNPILGETFEFIDSRPKSPVRCFTEQVSHHPPVTAVHAENDNFVFYQNYNAVTNFLGNSLEVNTNSKSYVELKATKEKFLIIAPKIRVHNLIMGTMWMEYFGDLVVNNLTTGATLSIKFGKTGWLAGGPNYEVTGTLQEKDGKKTMKVKGNWDTFLTATYLCDCEDGKKGESFTTWKRDKLNFAGKQFQMTPFAWGLNGFPAALQQFVLPSDSRRRPDRIALAMGECDTATAWKRVAEGQQRTEQKARRGDKKEDPWVPVWFNLEKDHEDLPFYGYGGKYWDLRKEQEALGEKGTCIMVDQIKNTAADFLHYQENFSGLLAGKSKQGIAVER